MLRKKIRLIPLAVVGVWVALMGWHLYDHVLLPQAAQVVYSSAVNDTQDVWMGIYVGGDQRVGFLNWNAVPEVRGDEEGIRLSTTAQMQLHLFEQDTSLLISGEAWLSRTDGVREFDGSMKSDAHEMAVAGTIKDGTLEATLTTAGVDLPLVFPVDDAMLRTGSQSFAGLTVPTLEPGQTIFIDAINPSTMSPGQAKLTRTGDETLTIGGVEYPAYVVETEIGGMTSKAWVDAGGHVLRAETPFGFALQIVDPTTALEPIDPAATSDLIMALAVRPTGETPMRGAETIRLRFGGVGEDRWPPVDPPYQTRDGDVYTMCAPRTRDAVEAAGELDDADLAGFLGDEPLIQVSHPTIRAAAEAAIGDAETTWERAVALHDWLYEGIDKVSVVSIPSALEVLATKEGDCNEHTILFAAMARAVDVPCRIAIGLVWSDVIGGFGYHAWPEINDDGAWIPMDPTLGQTIADATHIKLLNGNIEQWPGLVPYIGQLSIEVLDVKGAASGETGSDTTTAAG